MIAGSDEVGKGDYFGYIVVACVCCEEKWLKKIKVRDSKTLSEKQIFEMEKLIKEGCVFSIVMISPQRYNQLHKDSGGRYNLNEIIGWMHANAIKAVLAKSRADKITVDKFGKEESVLRNLDKKTRGKITFMSNGEKDLAVAAASILARAEFLRRQRYLSKEVGFALPRGSTHVKDAAKKVIETHDKEKLKQVAKIHFKITNEIL
jgi:ribonuclease HIII